jgi:hypothetical protein
LDDDFVLFRFDIHFTSPQKIEVINCHYPFSDLLCYVREQKPALHKYISSVHKSIERWGPHEPETIDALGEDAIEQLYDCLHRYLLQCDWMEKEYEREMFIRQQTTRQQIKTQQQAENVVHTLGQAFAGINLSNKKYYRFCETVEKQIRATATEVYPEIADFTPEGLNEFRYLFVSEIQAMHERLQKLLLKEKER